MSSENTILHRCLFSWDVLSEKNWDLGRVPLSLEFQTLMIAEK